MGLSVKQELALELILCGMNDREIAERAGVSRQTINTWRNHNEVFRMLLAGRREAARERHRDELSGLVLEAVGVMRAALLEGNLLTRLWAALALLRMSGLQEVVQTEKLPSQVDIIMELLIEAIRKIVQEKSIYAADRLPDEES
jgi:AcrR family transcriptional regulator